MKRTPWFPGTTHPVRRGWYERDHRNAGYDDPDDCVITLDLWEPDDDPSSSLYPGIWYVRDESYLFFNPITGEQKWIEDPINDASRQHLPWRGLTKRAD